MLEYNYNSKEEMFKDFFPETILEGDDVEGFNKAMKTALTSPYVCDPKDYNFNIIATSYNDLVNFIDGTILTVYTKNSHTPLAYIGIKGVGELMDKALLLHSMNQTKVTHVDKYNKTYGASTEINYI